jgi:hypothetical protein
MFIWFSQLLDRCSLDTDCSNIFVPFKAFFRIRILDGFKLDTYCLGMRSRGFSKLFLVGYCIR